MTRIFWRIKISFRIADISLLLNIKLAIITYSMKELPKASLNPLLNLVSSGMQQVNGVLLHNIRQDVPLIAEVAQHIIASGGKRLRPALTLACAELCGYSGNRHINLAATVELIHTATLLHDDVVDASTLRRGDKTANVIWSNQASVLVGDFLFSRAFQLMTADGSLEVLRILSDASATISQGEVLQLMTANDPLTSEASYFEVISAKTAALFAAACEIGAVISDKNSAAANLHAFGNALGIAFQLVDDALDYNSNQAKLGKTVGDDFREGKITLPVILAYQDGSPEEQAFWVRTLQNQEQNEQDFDHALNLLHRHQALARTMQKTLEYCQLAREKLAIFPDSPHKQALLEAVDFCATREY